MSDFATARRKMVDNQLRTDSVTAHAILDAMGDIAREEFVPASLKQLAYIDEDLQVRDADDETPARYLTRPAAFARMVQLAAPDDDDVVLLVGCGTGYGAAVLARLTSAVVALEADEALAGQAGETLLELGIDNAAVVTGPAAAGWKAEGPYDAIIVDGAVDEVPPALFDQLKDGGKLVATIGEGLSGTVILYGRTGKDVSGRSSFNLSLRPLPGFEKPREFAF